MRRCTTITPQHVQAELDNLARRIWLREKSFGQRLKFGAQGGNLCLWGPERFFSVIRYANLTYPFPGCARIFSSRISVWTFLHVSIARGRTGSAGSPAQRLSSFNCSRSFDTVPKTSAPKRPLPTGNEMRRCSWLA